jgi:hypothetical protein
LISRGQLVVWDRELLARRAVAEEAGEIARMQEENAAQARELSALMQAEEQARQATLTIATPEPIVVSSASLTPEVEVLLKERAALQAKVEQQAALMAQWSAELESLRRFASIARGVMIDLIGSRGYALMRLLGRWHSIERGINRALR